MSLDVTIATPTYDGTVLYETDRCMQAMILHARDQGLEVGCWRQPGPNLLDNRNACVNKAKKYESEYIFLIDADMIFPKDTLVRLLARKVDIVGCLYFNRRRPFMPNAAYYRNGKWEAITTWHHGLLDDLDGVAPGMLLVKMEVFDNVPKPHWEFPYFADTDSYGDEGYAFCRKAKEHAYKIHLDTTIPTGHMGKYPFKEQDHMNYRQAEAASRIITRQEATGDKTRIH